MQIAGWDVSEYQHGAFDLTADHFLNNMAGNAFSNFACMPLLISAVYVFIGKACVSSSEWATHRLQVSPSHPVDSSSEKEEVE